MTQYVYVRPRPGGRVRMPERNFRPMDAEGATVPRIDYYERLIIARDLEICDPPAVAPAERPDKAAIAEDAIDAGPAVPSESSSAAAKPSRSQKEK